MTASLQALLRDVPDFPRPGIAFKDITPILADASAFAEATALMAEPFRDAGVTKVVAVEARGFIFGGPVARALGVGLVPVRKPGKLPWDTHSHTYELEYGTDALEIHRDALTPADRVLLVDDVLATGGTAGAACRLVARFDAAVAGMSFLLELGFLDGRAHLASLGYGDGIEAVLHLP